MDSESRVVWIIFTVAKIAGALGAFICAMMLGAPWRMEITAFFNVVQLIVLVYAVVVLVLLMANTPDSNFWKVESVASMVLATLEIAAASAWQATKDAVESLNTSRVVNASESETKITIIPSAFRSSTSTNDSSEAEFVSMVVFGYITGIICLSHAVYVVMAKNTLQ